MNELDEAKLAAVEMARTRARLAESDWDRRRAICHFPLMVASVAFEMNKLMDALETSSNSEMIEGLIVHCETIIQAAYRQEFGREIGQ